MRREEVSLTYRSKGTQNNEGWLEMSETLPWFILCSWIYPLFSLVDTAYHARTMVPEFHFSWCQSPAQTFRKSWIYNGLHHLTPFTVTLLGSNETFSWAVLPPFQGQRACLLCSALFYASPFPSHYFHDKIKSHFIKIYVDKVWLLLIFFLWWLLDNSILI